MTIKKSELKNIKDIYAHLGVKWQTVYKWKEQLTVTQSKYYIKHDFIKRAGQLFSLSNAETEKLANSAGLSLSNSFIWGDNTCEFSQELVPDIGRVKPLPRQEKTRNLYFMRHFKNLLSSAYSGKLMDLCGAAQVSERMFRHIKSGRYLRKEPVLALLITLGLGLSEIQESLKAAGFILSRSMPNDVVVIWMLENEQCGGSGSKRLYRINETLDALGLPLLMTRCKEGE